MVNGRNNVLLNAVQKELLVSDKPTVILDTDVTQLI